MGSIEVGKDADLVIYDKFPLSDYAKVQKVLIDGNMSTSTATTKSAGAAPDRPKSRS